VATKKAPSTIPAAKLANYEKLVATSPKIERKGASVPYTSLNGHMFSYLAADGSMALRLSETDRESFTKKYKAPLAAFYGVVQKEYVVVPDALLKKTAELKKYFDLSYGYVNSLKPKPASESKAMSKAKTVKPKTAKPKVAKTGASKKAGR
jgi:hypothetical protein